MRPRLENIWPVRVDRMRIDVADGPWQGVILDGWNKSFTHIGLSKDTPEKV